MQQDGGTAGSSSYAELSKNGVAQFGQNVFVPPVATRAVNYIAKSYWSEGMFQGDIAEIILYNRKLTTQENADVQSYIANKYGLSMGGSTPTLAAPAGLGATAGSGSVALNWGAVSGATGYRVLRSTTSGGPYTQVASPASTQLLRHRPDQRHHLLLRGARLQRQPGVGQLPTGLAPRPVWVHWPLRPAWVPRQATARWH